MSSHCESIKKVQFDGLDAIEIITEQMRAILVYEIGPRIAFLGKPDGDNLLYWDKCSVGRNDWLLRGGHRVWLTRPFADESVDTYVPDNDYCELSIADDCVTAISPPNSTNMLKRGIRITILPTGSMQVTNFISNTGDLIYSGGVWSPTCVIPDGKKIRIPLGDPRSSWDIVRIVIPLVFAGNTSVLEDDQCYFVQNDLIVEPRGRVLKRVCCAPMGKVILECDSYCFEKYSPYNKLIRYPFNGCNTAVFVGKDNWMAELETFGGESEILPGETIENIEFWSIRNI